MIYRPAIAVVDRARARRAGDLLDAARRLDGLAPVRGDPREARPVLLGLRASTTPSPTCRSCSSARAWSRPSASRPTRACARSSTSCATRARPRRRSQRARAYSAGRLVLAFENTNAVAGTRPSRQIVFGEEIDPDAAIAALDAVTFERGARGRGGVATSSPSPASDRTPPTSSERVRARGSGADAAQPARGA